MKEPLQWLKLNQSNAFYGFKQLAIWIGFPIQRNRGGFHKAHKYYQSELYHQFRCSCIHPVSSFTLRAQWWSFTFCIFIGIPYKYLKKVVRDEQAEECEWTAPVQFGSTRYTRLGSMC